MIITNEDKWVMKLVHYFVTKKDYAPVLVHGVKNEIWLENKKGPYWIIRINSNYIHNDEQLKTDEFKMLSILKQIKRKNFAWKINALNINLNVNNGINSESFNVIDNICTSDGISLVENAEFKKIFPDLKLDLHDKTNDFELIYNVTNEINKKTDAENKKYAKIFTPKKIFVTYIILALCIITYIVDEISGNRLMLYGANLKLAIQNYELWRLITYAFFHGGSVHLLSNIYCLINIGPHIESKFGKTKFILIYLISAITGGLLSCSFHNTFSVGASGAIFGLMGAFIYLGLKFRLYFKNVIVNGILPVILINLFIGFTNSGIDNACHIGGLIGGVLSAMALGVSEEDDKVSLMNGKILLAIFILFEIYLVFFK